MEKSFDSSLLLQVKRIQVPEMRSGSCLRVKRVRLRRINDQTVLVTEPSPSPRPVNSPRVHTEPIFSTRNHNKLKMKMKIPTIDLAHSFNATLASTKPKRRLLSRNRCQSPRNEYPIFQNKGQSTMFNHNLNQIFSFSPKKVLTGLQSSQQYSKPKALSVQKPRSINQSLVYRLP